MMLSWSSISSPGVRNRPHAAAPACAVQPALQRRISLIDSSIGSTIDPEAIPVPTRIVFTVFLAVAIYNALELYFSILATFTRRRGLYFWSLLVSTTGVHSLAVGLLLNYYGVLGTGTARMLSIVLILVGWNTAIVAQSLVLYSRLHLLHFGVQTLRRVLLLILINSTWVSISGWIVVTGANIPGGASHERWLIAYSIWEKIEILYFFLQEIGLSLMYLVCCYTFWAQEAMRQSSRTRRLIQHLGFVNVLVIALDVIILYLEYSGNYLIQTSYKTWVYSVKLKVEISILNQLVDFVRVKRSMESQARITREMEQEWTRTLETTFGPGRSTASARSWSGRNGQLLISSTSFGSDPLSRAPTALAVSEPGVEISCPPKAGQRESAEQRSFGSFP